MKVAAATILSLIVASAYASPAAYSANQEVSTHGSTIASSANAYLEKRGGGLHGDYAQGATGANDSPPNDLNHASPPARGHQQHPQRSSSPELYGSNQPQHPTPPRVLGPYGIPQHSQQQHQVNQDASNPHKLSQNAQSAEGGANAKDEHDKSEDEDVSFASFEAEVAKFEASIARFEAEDAKFDYEDVDSEDEDSSYEVESIKFGADVAEFQARAAKLEAKDAKVKGDFARFKTEAAIFKVMAARFEAEVAKFKGKVAKLEAEKRLAFGVSPSDLS
ncbi:hypothetical protein BASA83_001438 [Batrachochytrium salamandrivorans]|nr:hypothetical protein BASA81_016726 [Batrachochytrium salamandrivorans]KAH9276164.1 hypothetical protein BASA83_001438 [Batrachochytrium salamandrivorans]